MKLWHFASVIPALVFAILGCSRETGGGSSPIRSVADLRGRRCGIVTGSAMQEVVDAVQKGVTYDAFNDTPSMLEALRLSIDGVSLNAS